ncbi:sucrase ferredoxin [Streptomyces purpurogeneiscleroticus]|uniref:sucrase ferredoxin n=1 Tax=Streptomyces purpurogeneiscleroticus TaxID=68259 RepID=UPI001CBFF748|nr:sucrase ferredoxin [Streptomyces purpurogeneiscleroticus]MBZ4017549.1 sucrase ferredoxin [Streptomyces purpurogeneiscleroticus]
MSTCATASRMAAEPLAGTAATARTWLLVEQSGPWGAQALTDSHLDPIVGRALEAATANTGVRVALIRRPGRHADRGASALRRVFVAHTAPGHSWIRTARIADPGTLLHLDFAALGAGTHGGLWEPYAGRPPVLVCTNGKRDRCCAVLGRPLAAELAADGMEAWEVTHIGGHRFSPTLFVLPYGYAYGRAEAPLVKDAVVAAREGRVVTDHCRGRSTWDRPAQAADLAVRELIGEDRADALDVTRTESNSSGEGTPPSWALTLAHADGRAWRVTVEQCAGDTPAPASCGASAIPPALMSVTDITALTPAIAAP